MHKVKLNILRLYPSQTQSGAYALVLVEEDGDRRIPIIIGTGEAQAIAMQIEGMNPPRPLTHDLFRNLSIAFDITISEVVIHKLEEGVFYAELTCHTGTREVKIDSRPSDAVALALRFKCPIYITESILAKAKIAFEQEESLSVMHEPDSSEFDKYDIAELTNMMNDAINKENYEWASKIRDEINNRKDK